MTPSSEHGLALHTIRVSLSIYMRDRVPVVVLEQGTEEMREEGAQVLARSVSILGFVGLPVMQVAKLKYLQEPFIIMSLVGLFFLPLVSHVCVDCVKKQICRVVMPLALMLRRTLASLPSSPAEDSFPSPSSAG